MCFMFLGGSARVHWPPAQGGHDVLAPALKGACTVHCPVGSAHPFPLPPPSPLHSMCSPTLPTGTAPRWRPLAKCVVCIGPLFLPPLSPLFNSMYMYSPTCPLALLFACTPKRRVMCTALPPLPPCPPFSTARTHRHCPLKLLLACTPQRFGRAARVGVAHQPARCRDVTSQVRQKARGCCFSADPRRLSSSEV